MTVFKGYMRIMKKNTGLILLYLGIFFGVTMALQAAAGKETYTSYESEKIKIGVVDKDNGPLAEGLVKWLEGMHHVTMLEDDREKLQEELFYRNVEYIVVIPEDFYESCMVNGESISVTKVPGSYSAYYVDQQLESCLNTMRTYLKAGFPRRKRQQRSRMKKEEKSPCWIQMKTVVRPDGSIISDIFHICFLHYSAM